MSKIEQITHILRHELSCGVYPVGGRFPSEYELAERFDTHKITTNKAVSLLVNEGWLRRGKRGSGTWVQRVCLFPRGQFCIVIPLLHAYFSAIVNGIQRQALNRSYLSCIMAPQSEDLNLFLRNLPGSVVKGVIVSGYGLIDTCGVPCLHVDEEYPDINTIRCDDHCGGIQMMREVIARGHRDIVIYSNGGSQRHRMSRIQGFHEAMREHGIVDCGERTFLGYGFQGNGRFHDSLQNLKLILKRYPGVTVIVTDSDDDAFAMIKAGAGMGLDIPGKISVTGFGAVHGISDYYPIASVNQHPERLGAAACDIMIDMIENGEPATSIHEKIDVELVNPDYIRRI